MFSTIIDRCGVMATVHKILSRLWNMFRFYVPCVLSTTEPSLVQFLFICKILCMAWNKAMELHNFCMSLWRGFPSITLHLRHSGCDGVSNHQHHDCLLKRLFWRRSKKTSKLRVTGFVLGIHRSQRANNTENVSIWWRRHDNYMISCEGIIVV